MEGGKFNYTKFKQGLEDWIFLPCVLGIATHLVEESLYIFYGINLQIPVVRNTGDTMWGFGMVLGSVLVKEKLGHLAGLTSLTLAFAAMNISEVPGLSPLSGADLWDLPLFYVGIISGAFFYEKAFNKTS